MKDKAKWREINIAASKAKREAVNKLIAAHKAEFAALHEAEAAKLGVVPHAVRRQKLVKKLRARADKLERDAE